MRRSFFASLAVALLLSGGVLCHAQPVVTEGLSVYYSFDSVNEDGLFLDGSGNNLHGLITLGFEDAHGDGLNDIRVDSEDKVRGAGSAWFHTEAEIKEDYIAICDPQLQPDHNDGCGEPLDDRPAYVPSTGYTVAAWMKVEDVGMDHSVYQSRAGGGGFVHNQVQSNGNLRFRIRGDANSDNIVQYNEPPGGDPIEFDEWFHYAGTYQKGADPEEPGEWAFYYNGEEVAGGEANGSVAGLDPLDLVGDWAQGAYIGLVPDFNRQTVGRTDEFYLFNRGLDADEIKQIFNARGEDGGNGATEIHLDFETDPEATGVIFYGTSEWRDEGGNDGGYLSITDALNGQSGAIEFPDVLDGASYEGKVSIMADLRVGGGTDRPADGFSFNLVRPDDPLLGAGSGYAASPTGEANLPEEGSTTGLAIGFDEWFSGGEDVVGMSIRVDGELIDQFEFPSLNGGNEDTESLQTGTETATNIFDVEAGDTDLEWAPLTIDLDADNNLVVTYKGVEVFNQVIDYERGPGQLFFGGRTGGANSNHHIDNIWISVGGTDTDPCDFDGDGQLGIGDLDILSSQVQSGQNDLAFDVNTDGAVDANDISFFVGDDSKLHTFMGDVNLDGEFNSGDLVEMFQAGTYETGNPATWSTGDFNGNGLSDSSDLVLAFQDGGYEAGPKWQGQVAGVPEPSSIVLLVLGAFAVFARTRRS